MHTRQDGSSPQLLRDRRTRTTRLLKYTDLEEWRRDNSHIHRGSLHCMLRAMRDQTKDADADLQGRHRIPSTDQFMAQELADPPRPCSYRDGQYPHPPSWSSRRGFLLRLHLQAPSISDMVRGPPHARSRRTKQKASVVHLPFPILIRDTSGSSRVFDYIHRCLGFLFFLPCCFYVLWLLCDFSYESYALAGTSTMSRSHPCNSSYSPS